MFAYFLVSAVDCVLGWLARLVWRRFVWMCGVCGISAFGCGGGFWVRGVCGISAFGLPLRVVLRMFDCMIWLIWWCVVSYCWVWVALLSMGFEFLFDFRLRGCLWW